MIIKAIHEVMICRFEYKTTIKQSDMCMILVIYNKLKDLTALSTSIFQHL